MKTIQLTEDQIKNLLVFLSSVVINPEGKRGITFLETQAMNEIVHILSYNSVKQDDKPKKDK